MTRDYLGWSIERVPGNGYWRAWRAGDLPLMADTQAGLREMLRDVRDGRMVYGPNGWRMV